MLQKGILTYACGPGMEGSKASTVGDEGPAALPTPLNSNYYSPDTVTLRLQYMSDKVTRVSDCHFQLQGSFRRQQHRRFVCCKSPNMAVIASMHCRWQPLWADPRP